MGSIPNNSSKETMDRHEAKAAEQGETILVHQDHLQRKLKSRQLQLIAIGGSVGTGLFVTIGHGLYKGGPAGMVLAWTIYAIMLALINNCTAEMTVFMPVSGAFVRMSAKWVDEAMGFFAGWNFFLYEAILIPFEITAIPLVLQYWRDDIPAVAVVAVTVALYFTINAFAVNVYGEAECYLSLGKIVLIGIVFFFTLITMSGGNPQHDAYGFRYWNQPGAFAEYNSTGTLGQFEGFLGALWSASFTQNGPEYVAMIAGESLNPRRQLKNAFKATYWRLFVFFVISAITVGIVIPYNDPSLIAYVTGQTTEGGSAAASPYIIAMNNMGITVLPDIVCALLVTSIFSAGNAYTYYASRSLYSLAIEGHAPRFLRTVTKNGVPMYCLFVASAFSLLSFLAVSQGASVGIDWLVSLVTAGQVINYIIICIVYLRFYYACKAQNLDRRSLPYYGWAQPYCGYVGLVFFTLVVTVYGYTVFLPGNFDVGTFFTYYLFVLLAPIFYFGWKLVKRTKVVPLVEVDLEWERPLVDAHEAQFEEVHLNFLGHCMEMVGLRREKDKSDA
ncbi:amino acid permease/ SLC12A domain-containing protein [Xylariaceae sp. FL1272]|nr:amino acid permease/ SLC12A domain-containing protein [Xylariaceae sp. FL1272]